MKTCAVDAVRAAGLRTMIHANICRQLDPGNISAMSMMIVSGLRKQSTATR
jgi:hypothetical protein